MSKTLHLNANILPSGRHTAAWRAKGDRASHLDVDQFIEIAQVAEQGTFDAVFLPDQSSLDPMAAERPWHSLDPALLFAVMARATQSIGFVATASTTFEHPYHVARRFASLDHISGGRAAWNIVTTQHALVAGNFGYTELPGKSERHQRASEFVDVVLKLWNSWEDDAFVGNVDSGVYLDLKRAAPIDHQGEFFKVRGPLGVPPTPQGHPVLFLAGDSVPSRDLGAHRADAMFTVQRTIEEAKSFYADVKKRAQGFGRDPDKVLVLPGLYPVVGSTEAEARARKAALDALLDPELERIKLARRFGVDPALLSLDEVLSPDILDAVDVHVSRGFVENAVRESQREKLTVRQLLFRNSDGHRMVIGTPEQIADDIERWLREGAADGFNLNFDIYPEGLKLFVENVVPELRRRGIFRHEYAGDTLRSHLGID